MASELQQLSGFTTFVRSSRLNPMRNLFRDYILSNGGNFHDLEEILAGRFTDQRLARRCAEDLTELCSFMLVELELADEWLWLFLPVALTQTAPLTRPVARPTATAASPIVPSPESALSHRSHTDRVFHLHDPISGRIDWLFESREGIQGPFASRHLAERALADFIRACGHRKREPEPKLEPPDLVADAIRRRIARI